MQQHELRQPKGATHTRKRVGRGNGSGRGTYSGKGMKGQKARAGGGVRPGFEGGQLPLVRRMARKRGFRNPFRIDYEEVNVGQLGARFAAGGEVNAASLRAARLIRSARRPVKVLGDGELSVKLSVEATSFTRSAIAKINEAGGSVRWLNGEPERPAAEPAAEDAGTAKRPRAQKAQTASSEPPTGGEEEAPDGAGS
ncbi:MAG: 50S ribosomal protein L15 [Dehalococcoidia bacterium]|nr:50S ribosomal protein L15 [Dehalococcoidia bacterium]